MRRERPWPSPAAFLADEREQFAPFEAILELGPERLDRGPRAHGWSARDLLAHLCGWHEVAAQVARELAEGDRSPRKKAADQAWETHGDELNAAIQREWAGLPPATFRRRARNATRALREGLASIPASRWWDSEEYFSYFLSEMQEHYADHSNALDVVLGRSPLAK